MAIKRTLIRFVWAMHAPVRYMDLLIIGPLLIAAALGMLLWALAGITSSGDALPIAHAAQIAPQAVTITGTVYGFTSGGQSAPIGIYEARGATLAEATQNAEILEAQIRQTATAQATGGR